MAPNRNASYSSVAAILPFVRKHAPIFHLHSEERYRPAPIAGFLDHTQPRIERPLIAQSMVEPEPLDSKVTLDDLDRLAHFGTKGGKDVYLTSVDDVTQEPTWLKGTIMMTPNGGTGTDRTGVVIIVKKGGGVVDVFYFCFFAFNWGGTVVDGQLGNHVGDWEHVMIRFINKVPKYVWLSQHANGEAYKFKTLRKDGSGNRPILYIAKGSHAIYPRMGNIDHTTPDINTPFLLVDRCNEGALYDPIGTSYMYTYAVDKDSSEKGEDDVEVPGFFEVVAPTNVLAGWLYFTGHWGDQERLYEAQAQRQEGKGVFRFRRYGDGPTGPAYKDLMREEVWPADQFAAGQKIRSSVSGGACANLKDWLARCFRRDKRERVDVDGNPVGKK